MTENMLCLTGTTGNIGGAVLHALMFNHLIPASEIVIATSSSPSSPRFRSYTNAGITVRQANYNDPASLERAYTGCTKLFLVSTPHIALDFNDAAPGTGREKHHFAAIDAARKVGVKHLYYCSLAFATGSKAGVMVAHERTEAYLKELPPREMEWTVIREGIYAESWPLYFGQFDPQGDERSEVIVAGDGKVAWTSIENLGLGTAVLLTDREEKWRRKTIYLAGTRSASLEDIAKVVSEEKGREVRLKIVSREEYERVAVEERKMEAPFVRWWAKTYGALSDSECDVKEPRLEEILQEKGRQLDSWEDVVRGMVRGEIVYKSSE